MVATSFQVKFDCADPARLAGFWARALGYQVQPPPEGYESWEEFLGARGLPRERWNEFGDYWTVMQDPEGNEFCVQ